MSIHLPDITIHLPVSAIRQNTYLQFLLIRKKSLTFAYELISY